MGLFSSKTVTTVGTSVSRVIDDASLPNSLKTGFAKNLVAEEDQATEYVMEEMTTSLSLRCRRMYNYGKQTYLYGVPNSSMKTSAAGRDATQAALNALAGAPVTIDYYHFGAFNNLHDGWKVLVEQYGYDSSTNKLTVNNKQVYLKDMQAVVTDATLAELASGSMDQWGIAPNAGYTPDRTVNTAGLGKPTPFVVDSASSVDYIKVTYCWQEAVDSVIEGVTVTNQQTKTGSFTFPVSNHDVVADYHQARYTVGGKSYYWTYLHGSGTQPAIDSVFNAVYAEGGQFFPLAYFRSKKVSVLADRTSTWYVQTKKLLHYLGMDIESIGGGIDGNPDIGEVEQAIVAMAVPAVTTNSIEQRYLFDFFDGLHSGMQSTPGATSKSLGSYRVGRSLGNSQQASSIVIQDKNFKMALAYRNIAKRMVGGTIGKIGTHASGYSVDNTVKAVDVLSGGSVNWNTSEKTHWYRRQITDAVYEEIQILGLKMTYWVFEGYTTTGDETDDILMIPIDKSIAEGYSLQDRELLYARSLHYIFNSRVVTKLKWYQTGVFRTLMVIAAIVITIWTYGASWQALAVALASMTITQIIVFFAILVLKYLLVQYAIKVFVKVVGVKFAFIAAIVALILGAYQYFADTPSSYLPSAQTLVNISTNLSKGVTNQIKTDFDALVAERDEFEAYKKEKEDRIKTADELLDTGFNLVPMIVLGENPSEFYQRTVHSGNIGALGIDMVGNFVDTALQLPRLSDSLGANTYG